VEQLTSDPSHALQESDLERFDMLEAMLNDEERGVTLRHSRVPERLAASVLDERAIAGIHAAAIDLTAAMRAPGSSSAVGRLSRPPSVGMLTGQSPSARRAGPDEEDEDVRVDPHLGAQDYEKGLVESYDAYSRACEQDRTEMDHAQRLKGSVLQGPQRLHGGCRSDTQRSQGARGAAESPGSERTAHGEAAGDLLQGARGSVNVNTGAHNLDKVTSSEQRDELYPAGRILHLLPFEMLPGPTAQEVKACCTALPCSPADAPTRVSDCVPASLPVESDCAREQDMHEREVGGLLEQVGVEEGVPVGGVAAPPCTLFLVDHVPQQAYYRIALCETMLADHFLSKYIASMDAVIESYGSGASVD
jgi:hypothetical protein